MLTRTTESAGSSPMVSVPCTLVNRPRTLARPRCRTTNPSSQWSGSSTHTPAAGSSTSSTTHTSVRAATIDDSNESAACSPVEPLPRQRLVPAAAPQRPGSRDIGQTRGIPQQ